MSAWPRTPASIAAATVLFLPSCSIIMPDINNGLSFIPSFRRPFTERTNPPMPEDPNAAIGGSVYLHYKALTRADTSA